LLLRACLLHDERGRDAWEQFKRDHGDLTELFRTDKGELKRLGPLLSQGLNASAAQADARLWTVLRTGRMREGLRAKIWQELLRNSLDVLRTVDVPTIVFRGAAAAQLLYDDAALRHSHDLDLLITSDQRASAILALEKVGFTRDATVPLEGGRQPVIALTHTTSLPLRLHSSLFELKGYDAPLDRLYERSAVTSLSATEARVLSPADMLLQTIVHATYAPTRYSLQWAADAYSIVAKYPALDWSVFAQQCALSGASLPVSVMLGYLTTELHVPIPPDTVALIAQRAAQASVFERDLALYGARAGAKSGLSALFGASRTFRHRVQLASWLLKPSAEYVRWAQNSTTARHRGGLAGRLWRYALRSQ
jgi:Uncharacterised nucleotidyltransferase